MGKRTVGQKHLESAETSAVDWICAALAVLTFFAYILVIAYSPEIFRRPLGSGTVVSIGIAAGVLVTVILVALAGFYTWLRNRCPRQ